MRWFWIALAVLYILLPYDLVPDTLPLRGWIDDILAGILLYRYLSRSNRPRPADPSGGGPQREPPPAGDGGEQAPPHEVLGVAPDAGPDEIRAAFRRLAGRYHPDKVSHLGPEFQALAEKRFKQILRAQEIMLRRRGR
jgi:hypothetical protein